MARILAALMAFCILLLGGTALADDAARLGLTIKSSVSGKQLPALLIQPREDVKSVVVKLKRSDGRSTQVSARNVAAGTQKELTVKQEPGTFEYTGNFAIQWGSGSKTTFTMRFQLSRSQKLTLTLRPQDVDLDARKIAFSINNLAAKAELSIVGANGKPLKTVKRAYRRAEPGTKLSIEWADPGADILYMDLKVWDAPRGVL